MRSFDLQTFRSLDKLHRSTNTCQRASETTYRGEFGAQSLLYPPDNSKFSLYSHPWPMQLGLETGSEEG
ncbi:hypothetical protein DPEC_G00176610 [Dallia pectoralis]|uniref:Uncharacterized protein n=1 Tax=Dallia pectoralis TaxID=75939 RepID=A0ACC2GEG1_DALPE|nr:hypothetical protein DPEC_G00176610 [Dallia pectoralis]